MCTFFVVNLQRDTPSWIKVTLLFCSELHGSDTVLGRRYTAIDMHNTDFLACFQTAIIYIAPVYVRTCMCIVGIAQLLVL